MRVAAGANPPEDEFAVQVYGSDRILPGQRHKRIPGGLVGDHVGRMPPDLDLLHRATCEVIGGEDQELAGSVLQGLVPMLRRDGIANHEQPPAVGRSLHIMWRDIDRHGDDTHGRKVDDAERVALLIGGVDEAGGDDRGGACLGQHGGGGQCHHSRSTEQRPT